MGFACRIHDLGKPSHDFDWDRLEVEGCLRVLGLGYRVLGFRL